MSEPRRWKDSADAPIGMRELLVSAQAPRPLDERAFRRGQSRVARLGVVPAAAAAVSVWVKVAAAGAVGLAATTAVVVESGWRPFEPLAAAPVVARTAALIAPKAVVVEESVVTAAPPSEPIAVITSSPTTPKLARKAAVQPTSEIEPVAPVDAPVWTPPEPPRTKSSLADELPILEDARRLLARSPETALERLRAHRERYPFGVLASERDIMELDALRRTGRVQDARDRAHAWLEREPNGIHAARLRSLLASLE